MGMEFGTWRCIREAERTSGSELPERGGADVAEVEGARVVLVLGVFVFVVSVGGGKSRALGGDEGVAGENDRDVVMPASEPPPLVVVEPQLGLEVLVQPLGSPALLEHADDVAVREPVSGQARQVEAGLVLSLSPLAHQVHDLALFGLPAVVACGHLRRPS